MISFCHCQLKIRIEIRDEIVEIVESRSRKFAMLKQLYRNCAKSTETRRVLKVFLKKVTLN